MKPTREQVLGLALKAGARQVAETLTVNGKDADDFISQLVALAYQAGAAAEREEAAQLIESPLGVKLATLNGGPEQGRLAQLAAAIRARKDQV